MKFLTNIVESISKVAVKVALAVVVLFADTFFIRAQESAERIYYRFDNATVDANYLSNTQAFANIEAFVENGSFEAFEIVSFSSPEGNYDYNFNLSTRRANALLKYLVSRYPQLNGKISVKPTAEAWEALRASVVSDTRLSESAKTAMLQIIDSNVSADAKEKKLAALQSYRYLYSNYFKTLRYAEIRFVEVAAEAPAEKTISLSKDAILFDLNSVEVDRNFGTNAQVLDNLFKVLDSCSADEIASIEILTKTSPDGTVADNDVCLKQRGQAVYDYIVARYPQLSGKISVRSAGEAWDELRNEVEADTTLSAESKSNILSIIDSPASADEKEAKLRALPEWKHLFEDIFSGLRYARVTVNTKAPAATKPEKKFVPVNKEAILFDLNSVVVDEEFSSNPEALDNIDAMLSGIDADEIENVTILAKTSPDGPVSVNNRCAKQRGQAAYDYIVKKYPELSGKITVHSAGEAWEDLRVAVESDASLSESSRSKILSIIVSPAADDQKEAKLRELPEWDHLFSEVFPGLRCAKVSVKRKERHAEPDVPVAKPAEITVEDEPLEVNDELKLDVEKVEIAPAPAVLYPRFAVSTNVVYDLAGVADGFHFTPNVSLEFPISHKWSTFIDYTFPWWVSKGNDRAWQILKWDIGSRYWINCRTPKNPMNILYGQFVGIDFGAGYYDIEPQHKGWQGEFQTVGLEYGYAWKLGRAWRLDAYVGAGWMGTHYRYYAGDSQDVHLLYQHHGKMQWFGPTKAGISVKYIFHTNDRRNGR